MNEPTTAGITYATREADEAVQLAADLGTGAWRTADTPVAELGALDSTMRPIDRLGAAGLGAFTHLLQRFQDLIDRMTGKVGTVRTFTEAWQRASTELDEAKVLFDRTVRNDTSSWSGEAAEAWQIRAGEYSQAMRGCAAAAKATAAMATAMGETIAGARTEVATRTDQLVDAIIALAQASTSVNGTTTELLARVERLAEAAAPSITRIEHDLGLEIARFRTSPPGHLQDLWQRLGVWFGALPRDADLTQTPPTDAERGDHGRGGAYLDGRSIRLVPRDPTVPEVTLPNNVGAEGFEVGPRWNLITPEHHYRVETDTDISFDQASTVFGDAIAEDPVPASGDLTGRPEGVTNNAGLNNLVRTYTYPSPDPSRYTDITVNYTLGDKHILQEGYVIRYGERMPDGTTRIVSYGEGNGIIQHPMNFIAHGIFGLGWKENQADIAAEVEHRLSP